MKQLDSETFTTNVLLGENVQISFRVSLQDTHTDLSHTAEVNPEKALHGMTRGNQQTLGVSGLGPFPTRHLLPSSLHAVLFGFARVSYEQIS